MGQEEGVGFFDIIGLRKDETHPFSQRMGQEEGEVF
jgi:hypothetical protein